MPSITGDSLIGNKMTRFVYLDETGTNIKKDAFTIVGGIIVHADNQMQALEDGLYKICRDLVPEELWNTDENSRPFFFHASDYINGNCPYKTRTTEGKWSLHDGMAIAEAIVSLCENVGVRMVWSGAENVEGKPKADLHIKAFAQTALRIDHYMLSEAHGEVCIIVAENHNEHKKQLKEIVSGLKNSGAIKSAGLEGSIIPIRTIKDVVHFVDKTDSFCIQIADTVCYLMKKATDDNPHYLDIFQRINKMGLTA